MIQYTVEELRQFDGRDGKPSYVAFKSRIYDVSQSNLWDSGLHFEHLAGNDLTEMFENAPHGEEVFKNIPIVAELKTKK